MLLRLLRTMPALIPPKTRIIPRRGHGSGGEAVLSPVSSFSPSQPGMFRGSGPVSGADGPDEGAVTESD